MTRLSAISFSYLLLLNINSLQRCFPSVSATNVFLPRGHRVAFFRGGGAADDDEIKKTEFEHLLQRAQIIPSEVLDDESSSLSPFRRFLSEGQQLPDLFTLCTMESVYKSGILENGGKERYMEIKQEFARELGEQFMNAGIEQESWSQEDQNENALLDHCINFMGSEYLHMSFFQVENFRQMVINNPLWRGLVKAALITRLGEDCPNVNEIVEDNDRFGETLSKCSDDS
mmetsp:Transcript_41379/g.47040  ORF Transcript_41379/g.47040 Transcript_41379/m.47040 type:complete len:229 (+) Transcript_41379:82-768(+)|eukprot:CAMPEP_0194147434 /NCGR_PEP_ID=MMETSP0152-20130528/24733_1 /TAXON_ID=1049557 /ORGANISM="Thalassiothrix antarctica, Strain L6-D1" /LENGTH=228 /DNA_ID=CAMNT_0038848275 /DNA_START=58 /DNA_END=744 /DNA_ORIENTATION=+